MIYVYKYIFETTHLQRNFGEKISTLAVVFL